MSRKVDVIFHGEAKPVQRTATYGREVNLLDQCAGWVCWTVRHIVYFLARI
ncbi:hypothetical protein SAMN04488094_101262 [Tropicimonas isoalkanivorans]|uniref:Uncharacterized protein n=1 Tax=Tropicimonas isoalkanivorans TaxID=441112 RepID=A0A1I1DIB3_9RHOB|nr:hypothetical protein SAMN04488094_101262 [Tropicimonas isoalkanivorans]